MIVGILGVGFLGTQIASYLENEGIIPLLVSRNLARVNQWDAEGRQAFLVNQKNNFDHLLSLSDALVVTVAPSEGASYEETYLSTAQQLIKSSIKKPLYYCSSTSVYGDRQGAEVDEESPLKPLSATAQVLVAAEKMYVGHTVVRIGELWGYERRIESRLKNTTSLPGDGSMCTNHTHVADAARAFVFLIKGGYKGIFNVCGNVHKTRKALYEELAKRYHFSLPPWDPSKQSPHRGSKIVLSQKIRSLGFSFQHEDYV